MTDLDQTLVQSEAEYERSRALSAVRPPTVDVPGFRLERPLGHGAFGEVWLAIEARTGRRVAIKFFSRHRGLDWPLLRREVGKLVEVSTDRRIVNLLQVGQDAEHPYYVMEYLEGGSLADRLASGPLPPDQAVKIFRMVVDALVFLHGKAILHCDLKPGNVLLDGRGEVRLADFGQARLSHEEGAGAGTLFFMAPEQAVAQARPDVRSDIYSLGALFYAMLTGRPPHAGEHASASLQRSSSVDEKLVAYREILDQTPAPIDHHEIPGVDRKIAGMIDRCLHHDPEERFENVGQVLKELEERERRRTQRPLLLFGVLGPLILLGALAAFGLVIFNRGADQAREALIEQTLEAHRDLARVIAAALDNDLDAVERRLNRPAKDAALLRAVRERDPAALQTFLDGQYEKYRQRAFHAWEMTVPGVEPGTESLVIRSPQEPSWGDMVKGDTAWRDAQSGVLVPLLAPVQDQDGREVAVLRVALEIDAFHSWIAIAENYPPVSACPDVLVLVLSGSQLLRHPCPEQGMEILPAQVDTLVESRSFRDPMRPSAEAGLAAAARLEKHADWKIIAVQSEKDALQSIDGLTSELRILGGVAVALGFIVLGVLLFILFRLSRRAS